MSPRDRVAAILDRNKQTPAQKDADHLIWLQTADSIFDIIKCPTLGIMPSARSVDDNRYLLIEKIKGYSNEHK